jgi:hypothetical protein
VHFESSVGLVADEELVWKRTSDVEKMPLYWPSVSSFSVQITDGPLRYAVVSFARGGKGNVTVVTNGVEKTLVLYYTSGPLRGTQRLTVKRETLGLVWDIKFEGMNIFRRPRAEARLKEETKGALERLAGPQDA